MRRWPMAARVVEEGGEETVGSDVVVSVASVPESGGMVVEGVGIDVAKYTRLLGFLFLPLISRKRYG